MKIVIMDGSAANPGDLNWKPFESLGDVTAYDITPSDRIIEHAYGAQAVITNKTPFTEEILEQLPDLKYIGVIATERLHQYAFENAGSKFQKIYFHTNT